MRQALSRSAVFALAVALLGIETSAQSAGQRVYVTNNFGAGSDSVSVIDGGANRLITTIPVGAGPIGIAVSPNGARAYVANESGDSVSVIDTATNTVIDTITPVLSPKDVAVSPDGQLVYVTRTGWNRIALIDTAINMILDNLQFPDPWYLAFAPNGATLYVTQLNQRTVSAVDTATRTVVGTVSLPFNPNLLAITPNGDFLYVGSLSNQVWVIETSTFSLVGTVPLAGTSRLEGLAVTPDGRRAYAVHGNQISVIDTATNIVVGNVPLGDGSHGRIAFTEGSCVRGYVTRNNGTIQVLKPDPFDVIMSDVRVGDSPAGVAVSPPAPGTWTVKAPMPTPRAALAAATAVGADGRSRIYAIGGSIEGFLLDTVEAYDPQTDTWTTVAPMSTPRAGLAAATGPDGRIYAIGGQGPSGELATVEAYNPVTNAWTSVAPLQFECIEGVTGRRGHAAATGPDGRIYAIGGHCRNSKASLADGTRNVEAYDPVTNTWTFMPPIPAAGVGRYSLAAATGSDGRIYGIGGAMLDAVGFEVIYSWASAFDSSTGAWSSASDLTARSDLAAATGADGRVYAIAGVGRDTTGRPIVLDLIEAYDPPTDSWTSCGCLPKSLRYSLAAATGSDGRIYVIGGRDQDGNYPNTVEAYGP